MAPPRIEWCSHKSSTVAILSVLLLLVVTVNASATLSKLKAYRTLDGTQNNLQAVFYGSAGIAFSRRCIRDANLTAISLVPTSRYPNARQISTKMAEVSSSTTEASTDLQYSAVFPSFANFVANDIAGVLTTTVSAAIPVPSCDRVYDYSCTSSNNLSLRYQKVVKSSDGAPINAATSYLDLSNLYGSSTDEANKLRAFTGGKLLSDIGSGAEEMIPIARGASGSPEVKIGDSRSNADILLASIHILFLREHNRIAASLAAVRPDWSDETLYQEARARNIAIYQKIVFDEFLPTLLGEALPSYQGYSANVDVTVDISFAFAAFKFYNSALCNVIAPWTAFTSAFVNPSPYFDASLSLSSSSTTFALQRFTLSELLEGMHKHRAQNIDVFYADSLSNRPLNSQGVSDLLADDLQRGRDVGLCSFAQIQTQLLRTPIATFSELSTNTQLSTALQTLYSSTDNVELLIGGLADENSPGAAVGAAVSSLFKSIIIDQFVRLRDGDRFYVQNVQFPDDLTVLLIHEASLGKIISRNSDYHPIGNVLLAPQQPDYRGADLLSSRPMLAKRYSFAQYLHPTFLLEWSIQNDEIQFQVSAATRGWVGIGFASSSERIDVIIGSVLDTGEVQLVDSFSTLGSSPVPDTLVGARNDLYRVAGKATDRVTTLRFTRKLSVADSAHDVEIKNVVMRIQWAYGRTSEWSYHAGNRGETALNLVQPEAQVGQPLHASFNLDGLRYLALADGLSLQWEVSPEEGSIVFQLNVTSGLGGWVGIGIQERNHAGMEKTDIALLTIDPDSNNYTIWDMWSNWNDRPQLDTISVEGQNQWKLRSFEDFSSKNQSADGSQPSGLAIIQFERPLLASDPFDLSIKDEIISLLWARGPSMAFEYHSLIHRGKVDVNLISPHYPLSLLASGGISNAFNLKKSGISETCLDLSGIPLHVAIHAFVHVAIWGIVVPLAVAMAHQGNDVKGSALIHAAAMFTFIPSILAYDISNLFSLSSWSDPHVIVGVLIMFLEVFQLTLGFMTAAAHLRRAFINHLQLLRTLHRIIAAVTWIFAQFNILYGLVNFFQMYSFVIVLYVVWIVAPVVVYIRKVFYKRKQVVSAIFDTSALEEISFRRFALTQEYIKKEDAALFHSKYLAVVKKVQQKHLAKGKFGGDDKSDTGSVQSNRSNNSDAGQVEVKAKFSLEEVAKHNKPDDCWVILGNNVLNVTGFAADHPGGKDKIVDNAGKDVTALFKEVGHSTFAMKMVGWYEIGVLERKKRPKRDSVFSDLNAEELRPESMMLTPGRWICREEDVREGVMDKKEIGGVSFLITKSEGRVLAFEEYCPHQKAPLAGGIIHRGCVICPWHAAKFDCASGEIEEAPSMRKLLTHAVSIRAGNVYVELRDPPPLEYFSTYDRTKDKRTVVIIGGGAAGTACATTLRGLGFEGRIIMINKESALPYDRTWLSKGLGLGLKLENMTLHPATWFEERDIETFRGLEVDTVLPNEKLIKFKGSRSPPLRYDMALVCTGGEPRRLGIPGENLGNICYFRTHSDQQKLEHLASAEKRVVIIGGGFIAMEVGSCLALLCHSVTHIVRSKHPMKLLGDTIGKALQKMHEDNRVHFITKAGVKAFEGEGGLVTRVVLNDGRVVVANLVVVCVGITLNTDILKDQVPLNPDDSVTVDEQMRIRGAANIWAAGDIVAYPVAGMGNVRSEHWKTALQQGAHVAKSMMGALDSLSDSAFKIGHIFWTVQFGRNLRFAGHGVSVEDKAGQRIDTIIDGSLDDMRMVVYYVTERDHVLGVLTCAMDPLATISAELFEINDMPSFNRDDPSAYTQALLTRFSPATDVLEHQAKDTNFEKQKQIFDEVSKLSMEISQSTSTTVGEGFTLSEVAKHTSATDCWTVVAGKVLDVTAFLDEHPGGKGILLKYAGKDATSAFEGKPHSNFAKSMLDWYAKGALVPEKASKPADTGILPSARTIDSKMSSRPSSPQTVGGSSSGPEPKPQLTAQEVAKHTKAEDCWMIVHGKVLNVSAFLEEHPGGRNVLLKHAGKDVTPLFDGKPHSGFAKSMLDWYAIGKLDEGDSSSVQRSSSSERDQHKQSRPSNASIQPSVSSNDKRKGSRKSSAEFLGTPKRKESLDSTWMAPENSLEVSSPSVRYPPHEVASDVVAAQEPTAAKADDGFTMEDVKKHNNVSDCWITIENKVYDVTAFLDEHPGGPVILQCAGGDATELFNAKPTSKKPHSKFARMMLDEYIIGALSKSSQSPPPSSSSRQKEVEAAKRKEDEKRKQEDEKRKDIERKREEEKRKEVEAQKNREEEEKHKREAEMAAAAAVTTSQADSGGITMEEVQKHNTATDCWLVIEDQVYDISAFVEDHPGGEIILEYAGKDATAAFKSKPGSKKPHSNFARSMLEEYLKGPLSKAPATVSVDAQREAESQKNREEEQRREEEAKKREAESQHNQQAQAAGVSKESSSSNSSGLSMEEVKKHNTPADCWLVIENQVYDISAFVDDHPGGEIILEYAGQDATAVFSSKPGSGRPHSKFARSMLEEYLKGPLSVRLDSEGTSVATEEKSSETSHKEEEEKKRKEEEERQAKEQKQEEERQREEQKNREEQQKEEQDRQKSEQSSSEGSLTMEDVKKHSLPTDCWIVIENNVYDISAFVEDHPGGEVILEYAGMDATEVFNCKPSSRKPHSKFARSMLEEYLKGPLAISATSPVQPSPSAVSSPPPAVDGAIKSTPAAPESKALVVPQPVANPPVVLTLPTESIKPQTPPPVAPQEAGTKKYTLEEVSKHNKATDCWIIVHGKVHDVTTFVEDHPGGRAILFGAGKDGTAAFSAKPHSAFARTVLKDYEIGDFDATSVAPIGSRHSAGIIGLTKLMPVPKSAVRPATPQGVTSSASLGPPRSPRSVQSANPTSRTTPRANTKRPSILLSDGPATTAASSPTISATAAATIPSSSDETVAKTTSSSFSIFSSVSQPNPAQIENTSVTHAKVEETKQSDTASGISFAVTSVTNSKPSTPLRITSEEQQRDATDGEVSISQGESDTSDQSFHPAAIDIADEFSGITREEVAKHCTENDCWVIVKGEALDVTGFLKEHPGGRDILFSFAGKDATEAFVKRGHSRFAQSMLQWLSQGEVMD